MNKYLIVLMAICLVNVHAFVKRDAPASENAMENIQKQIIDIAKNINDKITENINPEAAKKLFNDALDNISKGIEEIKKKTEVEKKA